MARTERSTFHPVYPSPTDGQPGCNVPEFPFINFSFPNSPTICMCTCHGSRVANLFEHGSLFAPGIYCGNYNNLLEPDFPSFSNHLLLGDHRSITANQCVYFDSEEPPISSGGHVTNYLGQTAQHAAEVPVFPSNCYEIQQQSGIQSGILFGRSTSFLEIPRNSVATSSSSSIHISKPTLVQDNAVGVFTRASSISSTDPFSQWSSPNLLGIYPESPNSQHSRYVPVGEQLHAPLTRELGEPPSQLLWHIIGGDATLHSVLQKIPRAHQPPKAHSVKPSSRKAPCKAEVRHPPDDKRAALCELLSIIRNSDFLHEDALEPTIGSESATDILQEVKAKTGVWLGADSKQGGSIYMLFLDPDSNRSWICGESKGTSGRAVSHIRSLLNHRPFVCLGVAHGCSSSNCVKDTRVSRFFSETLLGEHMAALNSKNACKICGKFVLKKGVPRYMRNMHQKSNGISERRVSGSRT